MKLLGFIVLVMVLMFVLCVLLLMTATKEKLPEGVHCCYHRQEAMMFRPL